MDQLATIPLYSMMPVLCATMPTRTSIGINVGRISVVYQGSMNLLSIGVTSRSIIEVKL